MTPEVSVDKERSDQEQRELMTPEQCREHREKLLDQALEETFPASDPPSIADARRICGKDEI